MWKTYTKPYLPKEFELLKIIPEPTFLIVDTNKEKVAKGQSFPLVTETYFIFQDTAKSIPDMQTRKAQAIYWAKEVKEREREKKENSFSPPNQFDLLPWSIFSACLVYIVY